MKRFTVVAAVLVSMLFTSCRDKVMGQYYAPGYIAKYYAFSEQRYAFGADNVQMENGIFSVRFPFGAIRFSAETNDYLIDGEESDYYKFCVKFNDLSYNQCISFMTSGITKTTGAYAISDVVAGVEILCDEDWASGYPAGTLLNDIFSIRLISLYPYVSCGYTGNVDTLIDKPLSDVTSEDMTLIRLNRAEDGVFNLYTSVLPDESVRTLRVRLSTDEGRELEYAFNFGAGE